MSLRCIKHQAFSAQPILVQIYEGRWPLPYITFTHNFKKCTQNFNKIQKEGKMMLKQINKFFFLNEKITKNIVKKDQYYILIKGIFFSTTGMVAQQSLMTKTLGHAKKMIL